MTSGLVSMGRRSFAWKRLKIGGGGSCSSMDTHSDGTILCRIDVFGAYLLPPGGTVWRQLVTTATMPVADSIISGDPYASLGVSEIRFAPTNSSRLYMLY